MHSVEKRWPKIKNYTNIDKDQFLNTTRIVLTSTYFNFNNETYLQKEGIAMGSPISANTANIVMEDLENDIIKNNNLKISFYRRYMDDCILACDPSEIDKILRKFNAYHERINFTIETEKNDTLNFLDITLNHNKNNGTITTSWYNKPIFSERLLNYLSNTPINNKITTIYGLIDRAVLLSSPKFIKQNINKVKDILKTNNYPQKFINKYIKKRLNIIKNRKQKDEHISQNEERKKRKFHSFPYTNNISEKITKVIQKKTDLEICYRKTNSLTSLYTDLKTKIPTEYQSGVIYKISCKECPVTYIGQTGNYIRDRVNAHKRSIKKGSTETALSKHALGELHGFDFNNVQILEKETNEEKRRFKEMLHIRKTDNTVNNNEDIRGVSTLYNNILK